MKPTSSPKWGYSRLANNDNKTAAKEVLAKALALYERAMKESFAGRQKGSGQC